MFPLSHKGRGDLSADFLRLCNAPNSPLPLWERDADTGGEFCSSSLLKNLARAQLG
jgi:hypothetical protein